MRSFTKLDPALLTTETGRYRMQLRSGQERRVKADQVGSYIPEITSRGITMAAFKAAAYFRSPDYLSRFILHIKKSRCFPFDISGFTELNALEKQIGACGADLLLTEEVLKGETQHLNGKIRKTVYLKETGDSLVLDHTGKYQSVQNIVSDLLAIYGEMEGEQQEASAVSDADIYGVMSLSGAGARSSLALKVAGTLHGAGNVLYIEPERFSGLYLMAPARPEKRMADVIYLYKTGSEKFREIFRQAVIHAGNTDILADISATEDLSVIEAGEWPDLIGKMAALGGYSAVIIGITEVFLQPLRIIEMCRAVYICGAEDMRSRNTLARLREMEIYLSENGREDLMERMLIATGENEE